MTWAFLVQRALKIGRDLGDAYYYWDFTNKTRDKIEMFCYLYIFLLFFKQIHKNCYCYN